METLSLNLVDSSFEHVLHLNDFHLVSTYKYEIQNCLFHFLFLLLDNHLSTLELRQYNMAHLNHWLVLKTKKPNNVMFEN